MPKQIHSWQNLFGACRAFFETGQKKPNQVKKNQSFSLSTYAWNSPLAIAFSSSVYMISGFLPIFSIAFFVP
jgi:hypothetical protein